MFKNEADALAFVQSVILNIWQEHKSLHRVIHPAFKQLIIHAFRAALVDRMRKVPVEPPVQPQPGLKTGDSVLVHSPQHSPTIMVVVGIHRRIRSGEVFYMCRSRNGPMFQLAVSRDEIVYIIKTFGIQEEGTTTGKGKTLFPDPEDETDYENDRD